MINNLHRFVVLFAIVAVGLCCISTEGLGQTDAKVLKVMIDPGHGGDDTGSKGSSGVSEKDLTLALAKKIVQVLEVTETLRPELVRTDDYAISLDERAGLANHREGDLLISLHLGNTFVPVPAGVSIYY